MIKSNGTCRQFSCQVLSVVMRACMTMTGMQFTFDIFFIAIQLPHGTIQIVRQYEQFKSSYHDYMATPKRFHAKFVCQIKMVKCSS